MIVTDGPLDSISGYTTASPLPVYTMDVRLADLLDLTRDNPVRYQNPAGQIMYKGKWIHVISIFTWEIFLIYRAIQ